VSLSLSEPLPVQGLAPVLARWSLWLSVPVQELVWLALALAHAEAHS
jgi:hypothetical protein